MALNLSSCRPLTSIVSYPERGEGGNNKYRGNCSPKLIEDLIGFFKPEEICDYMCGSGTTASAASKMGIGSHCYDLHSGFDLLNSEILERPSSFSGTRRTGTSSSIRIKCIAQKLYAPNTVLIRVRWIYRGFLIGIRLYPL